MQLSTNGGEEDRGFEVQSDDMKKTVISILLVVLLACSAVAENRIHVKFGDYGAEVIALHQKLKELGYYSLRPESPWGPASADALMILQENMGWEINGSINDESQLNTILCLEHVIGRNLLADTDYLIEKDRYSEAVEAKSFKLRDDVDLDTLVDKTVTLSIYVNSPGERGTSVEDSSNYMVNRFGCHMTIKWGDSTGALEDKTVYPCTELLSQSVDDMRISSTYRIIAPDGYDTIKGIGVAVQAGARPAEGNNSVWKLGYPKLEYGAKATDWVGE